MKFDRDIVANTGVIVAIIFTIGSAILASFAFTVEDLSTYAKVFVVLVFLCNVINLYINLKMKKYGKTKDRLDR
ncbi:MAG: hypothetical protein IKU67_00465 [Firmicutes bacterium]|nr:hypothetical protein [Bacillota bacterium]